MSGRVVKGIKILLNFIYVTIAWVFFRAATASDALSLLGKIVTPSAWEGHHISIRLAEAFQFDELWYIFKVTPIANMKYGAYSCMWLILIFALSVVFRGREAREISLNVKNRAGACVIAGLLFVWCTLSLGGVSTFLYVNF